MVLIYCKLFTDRCKFVFDWIFDQWGIKYSVTSDSDQFISNIGPKIWYDRKKLSSGDTISLFASGMLFETQIVQKQVRVVATDRTDRALLFDSDGEFDIFSCVFFMLTRYEEYLPYVPDIHGRFPASASVCFGNRLLDIPIVDIWVAQLKRRLEQRYPALSFTPGHFEGFLTYDVDIAYKYRGRSLARQLRSAAKDMILIDPKNLINRLTVLTGFKRDPWDIYNWLQRQAEESEIRSIFFVQCGANSQFDKNLSATSDVMKDLVKRLGRFATLGLHPSYYSMERPLRIQEEKALLTRITGAEIKLSRHHFLRIKFPDTFRELINSGIEQDYSVGYPETPGFRAGTSKPFYFFDLKENKSTPLKLFPISWMDSTFLNYFHQGPRAALKAAEDIITKTKEVGGIFIPIFHNFVLVENGWVDTYCRIKKLLSKKMRDG